MRIFRRLAGPITVVSVAGLVLLATACSGSSSETPWPAEPLDLEPGPAGEERLRGNVVDTKKLPDNYKKEQEKREKEKKQAAPASSTSPEK